MKKPTQYEKYVELVKETETAYICTIWTGPYYYIGYFCKQDVDGFMEYAAETGHYVSFENAIARTSVSDMHFMCKTEDYNEDVLQAWIECMTHPEKEVVSAQDHEW